MPACPVCAFDNPGSAAQCGDCGADLRADMLTTTPAGGPTTPLQETASPRATASCPAPTAPGGGPGSAGPGRAVREPAAGPGGPAPGDGAGPARGRPGRRGADLSLEPAELQVEPGSAGTVTVTVHNLGTEVERFTLEVNGPGGAFAAATPRDLRMLPDKRESAVVRFAPARDPAQRAGPQPFQVVARSTVNPDVVQRASGVVTVGGFARLDADLVPEVTRGRRKPGVHRLELVNAGNRPAAVGARFSDDSGELAFDPPTAELRLEPGERQELTVEVTAPCPWFGRTQSYPFAAEVTATDVPQPVRLTGTRRQVPRFPWWVPTAALALVAVALAVWGLVPKDEPTVPHVAQGTELAAAHERLTDEDYQPVVVEQPHEHVEAGKVIGTEPEGGQPLAKGESVSLLVSLGRCPQGCPVAVPTVVGLAAEEATRHLERAGFVPQRVEEVSAEVRAGHVIRSDPPAPTPLQEGSTVTVVVATAPPPTTAASSGPGSSGPAGGGGQPGGGGGGGAGGGGSAVLVPGLVGRPQAEAEEELRRAGLVPALAQLHSNAAPEGTVLSSRPAPGAEAERGATVTLTVTAPTDVDLLAVAGDARWEADGAELDLPVVEGSGPPVVRVDEPDPADRAGRPVLVTEPTADGSLTGTFVLEPPLIEGDHLRAEVARLEGEVALSVVVDGQALVPELGPEVDGAREFAVDLSSAAGAAQIEIAISDLEGTGSPEVRWQNLRIEGRTE